MVRNEVDSLCFNVLQVQQHDLGCVLKEGGPVLLLPFLHPVAVNAKGATVDKLTDAAEGIRVSGQHLPCQRAHPSIAAVYADAGENADYQHLSRESRRQGFIA